jgi:REP element-mobilizing transposase RayT
MTKPFNSTRNTGQANLRKGRCSIVGGYYFITIVTEKRQSFFDIKRASEIIFGSLEFLESEGTIKLICCVIMPDHVHLIFELLKDNLADVMARLK